MKHNQYFARINSKGQVGTYIVFVVLLIIIAIAGYFVFLEFTKNMAALGTLPLLAVAVFAGLATFFSPCSFGLLPAYLSLGAKNRVRGAFRNGILASAGLVTFNVFLGVILALAGLGLGSAFSVAGVGQLSSITLTIRAIVGGILFVLGILQFFHISIQGQLFKNISQKFVSGNRNSKKYFLYGFAYNLSNIGCTGPILTGLIVLALASGFNAALLAFAIYSLTMGILMLAVSLLVGSSKISFLRKSSHKIMKISAIVLMLAGLFIILTVIYAEQFVVSFFP